MITTLPVNTRIIPSNIWIILGTHGRAEGLKGVEFKKKTVYQPGGEYKGSRGSH